MKRRNRIQATLQRGLTRAFVLVPLVFLLVAGAGCPSLFDSTTQRATRIRQAEAGRNGTLTVPAADTVVNAYAQLSGTSDPAAGDTIITVADITTLATHFSTALASGDLLLIIQMAGATIDTTPNDSPNYGAITDLGSAGRYELVGVEGVTSNRITLACRLKNSYSRNGKTQVIRVPQYTTLTIPIGTSITAPAWDGTTGGVVAVHAESTLDLNGSVDVSAKGFRGGATDNLSRALGTAVTLYRSATDSDGAEKGESIAGYQDGYTSGRYGRGAPANGGGGGNSYNAGGGGGANASHGATWTGQGVMEQCALGEAWRAAWQLDDSYGSTCTNSEGGGRGGYSSSASSQSPLTDAPGTCADVTSWGGNCRREVGGLGGRPVANDPASRLFMGGGGGAGDGDSSIAGRGGNGGGLVFLIAGSVTGSGSILANGEDGADSVFATGGTGGDAAGGGGGGGTVVVTTSSSGISISVDGGQGGNQVGSISQNEVEGPGGGGGGGYIAVSGGTPTLSAAGGPAGTTDRTAMTTFAANGATAGNIGQTNGNAATFLYCGFGTSATPVTTIQNHPDSTTTSTTGTFTFHANEASVLLGAGEVTFECKLDSATFASCSSGYSVQNLVGGHHTFTVRATDVASGNVEENPTSVTWMIIGFDSGVVTTYDSAPAVDLGANDSGEPLLDAEGMDVAVDDLIGELDVGNPDRASDTIVVIKRDTAPVYAVDGNEGNNDGPAVDVLPLLDSGAALDVQSRDGAAVLVDAQWSGAEPNPDTATIPTPNPDTAVANEDAAISLIKKDAASFVDDFKVQGSGFCAIASSRSTSPLSFVVLGLAALALFRRRRDGRDKP
jgi:hypothetical protein